MLLEIANLEDRPRFSGSTAGRLRIPDFLQPSRPPRRLGVTVQELDDTELDALGLGAKQGGLRIDRVHERTAAEAAGVRAGDVLLEMAGNTLPRTGARDRLRKILTDDVRPGREVPVIVLRNRERVALKAKWPE